MREDFRKGREKYKIYRIFDITYRFDATIRNLSLPYQSKITYSKMRQVIYADFKNFEFDYFYER